MTFWDFYNMHPWLGTLVVLLVASMSINISLQFAGARRKSDAAAKVDP